MRRICFLIQHTKRIYRRCRPAERLLGAEIRTNLQAAAALQTPRRLIPRGVRARMLIRLAVQPHLHLFEPVKHHAPIHNQVAHKREFAQRFKQQPATFDVAQKHGTRQTRHSVDAHRAGTAFAHQTAAFPANRLRRCPCRIQQRRPRIQLAQGIRNRGIAVALTAKCLPVHRVLRAVLPSDLNFIRHIVTSPHVIERFPC